MFDPYYGNSSGTLAAVPCRHSYLILMSDGAWNGSVDPACVAQYLHTTDQRTDLSYGPHTIGIYALYTFGQDDTNPTCSSSISLGRGDWSMKTVAAFGGFNYNACGPSTTMPYGFLKYLRAQPAIRAASVRRGLWQIATGIARTELPRGTRVQQLLQDRMEPEPDQAPQRRCATVHG